MKHKYQAYASATQTVAKTKQIIMLYDAVIRSLQQVKEAINENRIQDRYNLLIKAGEIIFGLQSCLDFENGKDIARILYNFYASIDSRMFAIHRSNSIEDCEEIIVELKQMRDVWREIDESTSDTAVTSSEPENLANDTVADTGQEAEQNISFSA